MSARPIIEPMPDRISTFRVLLAGDPEALVGFIRLHETAGHLHRDHTLANLSLNTAARLRDLLDEAITHAHSVTLDTRQTVLWWPATVPSIASRFCRKAAVIALLALGVATATPTFAADPCPVGIACPVPQPVTQQPQPAEEAGSVRVEIMKLRQVQTQSLGVQIELLNALRQMQAAQAVRP